MNETMQQNQGNEALAKKARNVRCIFSLVMGLMCLITLFFPLFRTKPVEAEKFYFVENGLDMMYFNSGFLWGKLDYLPTLFGLLCWLQFILAIGTIIMSAIATFKFTNKSMSTITLILPLVCLFFMFAYMLEGSITCVEKNADFKETVFLTFSYIPFILGVIVFGLGLFLCFKNKMPVERNGYQQTMNYGMANGNANYNYSNANMNSNANNYSNANMNNNYIDTGAANVGGGETGANANDGGLLSESQIQTYLMSIKSNVPNESISLLSQQLHRVSQSKMSQLAYLPMKNSTTILLISIFLGAFGVDRFMLGDIGIGVCKLLFSSFTLGIWPLVDIFMCYKKVKEKNLEDIMMCITNNRI